MMDLDLLNDHARRYGSWDILVTPADKLTCEFHRPQNADQVSWDEYAYYHNGSRINKTSAEELLGRAFERRLQSA